MAETFQKIKVALPEDIANAFQETCYIMDRFDEERIYLLNVLNELDSGWTGPDAYYCKLLLRNYVSEQGRITKLISAMQQAIAAIKNRAQQINDLDKQMANDIYRKMNN